MAFDNSIVLIGLVATGLFLDYLIGFLFVVQFNGQQVVTIGVCTKVECGFCGGHVLFNKNLTGQGGYL